MGVVNQTTVVTVNGTQMPGGTIDLTIPGGTADPNTGEIVFPASSAVGTTKFFTLIQADVDNKYVLVDTDITNDASTKMEIETLPAPFYGSSFVVDGVNKKKVKWDGLDLDGLVIAGDKVAITYS
jgi:hypothetical protein